MISGWKHEVCRVRRGTIPCGLQFPTHGKYEVKLLRISAMLAAICSGQEGRLKK